MRFATGMHEATGRIIKALGLDNVRALSLTMAHDDVVVVTVTQCVTGKQLEQIADELETRQYVLVPKSEWERYSWRVDPLPAPPEVE